MGVTITTSPPAIAFSRNEIKLAINSDNYQAAAPVTSVNALDFTGVIAVDDTINLAWTGGAAIIKAKAVPDDSGLQIPTGDGGNDYVTSLVDWFFGNYLIRRNYTVTADLTGAHPRLVFTARAQSPDYDFSVFAIGHVICSVVTPGVTDQPVANFAHHIQQLIADPAATTFTSALDENVPLDENPRTGTTTIDLSDSLDVFLTPDRPVLAAPYERCINSIRQYYVLYAQVFGTNPAVQRVRSTGIKVITKGGLGKQASLLRDIFTELQLVAGTPASDRFCRQGSKNKLVLKQQPEWLTYINLTAATITATLEIKVYNDDETSITFTTAVGLAIPAYSKWQFQTGFDQLGITDRQAAGKKPLYYTARLKNEAAAYISAEYAYVVEYQYREFPRFFIYENSLGAFQTICTIGRGVPSFDKTADDAQLTVGKRTAPFSGEFIQSNITFQDKYTVNYGYRQSWQRDTALIRDLARSETVFLYENGVLLPIGIDTKNFKDAEDGKNLYAGTFDYYPKYIEDVFTEPAGLADDSLADLLTLAGSPIPTSVPDIPAASGNLVVESTSPRLSIVADQQVYTNIFYLAGKTGYRVYSTQLGLYFRSDDLAYDLAGNFTILQPEGFVLQAGDQLIIWPNLTAIDA